MKWHITRNLQTKYISVLVSAISLFKWSIRFNAGTKMYLTWLLFLFPEMLVE